MATYPTLYPQGQEGSTYIDSRDEAVELDYNYLRINCPLALHSNVWNLTGDHQFFVCPVQTTDTAVWHTALYFTTTPGTSYYVRWMTTALCTSGPLINLTGTRDNVSMIKNIGGTVTILSVSNNQLFEGALAPNFGFFQVAGTNLVQFQVSNGNAGNNINFNNAFVIMSSN